MTCHLGHCSTPSHTVPQKKMFWPTTHTNAHAHREQTQWGEVKIIHEVHPQFYSYAKTTVKGLDKMVLGLVMKKSRSFSRLEKWV